MTTASLLLGLVFLVALATLRQANQVLRAIENYHHEED